MGVLKAFVIASGVVLLVGTIVLAAIIITRAIGDSNAPVAVPGAPAVVDLELPVNGQIERVIPDDDQILLLGRADHGQFLMVLDAETGERLRLIRFRPAP